MLLVLMLSQLRGELHQYSCQAHALQALQPVHVRQRPTLHGLEDRIVPFQA